MYQAHFRQNNPGKTIAIELIPLSLLLLAVISFIQYYSDQTLFRSALQDSSHTLVFFLGSLLALRLSAMLSRPRRLSTATRSVMVAALCFVAGIIIELIQPMFGRSTSFLDIWYDLLGVSAAAICFYLASQDRRSGPTSWIKTSSMASIAILLLAISTILPAYYYHIEQRQQRALPTLVDFEHHWQNELFHASYGGHVAVIEAPASWHHAAGKVAKLTLSNQTYPGITFKHLPADWSSYQTLKFELFSKHTQTRNIELRIHDKQHDNRYQDRFNKTLSVVKGLNEVSIPLSEVLTGPDAREMNMQELDGLGLFAISPTEPLVVYLDNLRLE